MCLGGGGGYLSGMCISEIPLSGSLDTLNSRLGETPKVPASGFGGGS